MTHKKVMGVYAHPDDADVGAGGTLANFVRNGAEVRLVIVTTGDAGGFEAEGQENMPNVRKAEQRAAAKELGITDVVFLEGYRDGHVMVEENLERDIVEQIRQFQPTLITTTSPEHNWQSLAASHPDHRAVGEVTVRAVYPAARNPFAIPELAREGLEPWHVQEVWFQGHHTPNMYVELDPEDLERKVAAVACHGSQFQDIERIQGFVRTMAADAAAALGMSDGRLAERFFGYSSR